MIFESLFAIFVLLSGGYIAKRVGVLKQKQSRALLDFAIIFAVPCLIFDKIYHLEFNYSLILIIFIGFLSTIFSGIISIFIGKLFKFTKATLISMFILSSFGNTLFVGMPVISGIFGDEYMGEVIFYDALAGAIPISIIVPLILPKKEDEKVSILKNIKKIFYFPPFFGLITGLILKPFSIPDFIFTPINMFGLAATPVALFAIGLSLGFGAIKNSYKSTFVVLICKMVIAPFLFIIILKIFNFEFNKTIITAILESSMPTAAIACAIVMKAKLDSNLAVSSVAFGLIFSLVTLPFLTFLFV